MLFDDFFEGGVELGWRQGIFDVCIMGGDEDVGLHAQVVKQMCQNFVRTFTKLVGEQNLMAAHTSLSDKLIILIG